MILTTAGSWGWGYGWSDFAASRKKQEIAAFDPENVRAVLDGNIEEARRIAEGKIATFRIQGNFRSGMTSNWLAESGGGIPDYQIGWTWVGGSETKYPVVQSLREEKDQSRESRKSVAKQGLSWEAYRGLRLLEDWISVAKPQAAEELTTRTWD